MPRDTPDKLAFMLDSLVRVSQQQRWKNQRNKLVFCLSMSGSLGLVVGTWKHERWQDKRDNRHVRQQRGCDVNVNTVGTFWSRPCFVPLVTSSLGAWKTLPVSFREVSHHLASACRGRLPPGSRRSALSLRADRVLRPRRDRGPPSPGGKQQVATQCHGSVSSSYTASMSLASRPGEPSGSSDGPKASCPHIQ